MSLRVAGEVVDVSAKQWSMEGRTGVTRKARVQTSRKDWVDVTFPDDQPLPADGDVVDLAVRASVSGSSVKITSLGPWDVVNRVPGPRGARAATPTPAASGS